MKYLAWGLILALTVLHQDFWNWDDGTLVFGFLPMGLAYHALISLLAAAAWCFVVNVAWPADSDDDGESSSSPPDGKAAH